MAILIEKFSLGWTRDKGAGFRIKPVNGGWSDWQYVTAADLAAVAAIFRHAPVYVHPNGSITTDQESIGD